MNNNELREELEMLGELIQLDIDCSTAVVEHGKTLRLRVITKTGDRVETSLIEVHSNGKYLATKSIPGLNTSFYAGVGDLNFELKI
jgi:hypothetical protein